MVKWFKSLFSRGDTSRDGYVARMEAASEPWAMFEVNGFDTESGRVKVGFAWNQAFIDELNRLGFTAETQEDTVQLFFYASQMKPTSLSMDGGDSSVQPTDLPNLSPNVNRVVQ